MYTIYINKTRWVTLPSIYKIYNCTDNLSQQELEKEAMFNFSEYYSKKRERITEDQSLKDILFRNWIYSSLMINVMFEYLISGEGNIADFYENNEVSHEESFIHIEQLKKKIFPIGKTSWGLFAPNAIQHAFDNHEQDPGNVLYNLFFCLGMKDNYIAHLFTSNYNNLFQPSSFTRDEAHALLSGIICEIYNKFAGKIFNLFEKNEGVAYNDLRKGNRIRLFRNAFDSRIIMEDGMTLMGESLPEGKFKGKLKHSDLKIEEGIFDENGDLIKGDVRSHGYLERGEFLNGKLMKGTKKTPTGEISFIEEDRDTNGDIRFKGIGERLLDSFRDSLR